MSGIDEGVRLAKRVAALQSCSRSQAEALIAAGAVQVAGQTVTDPARRVRDEQAVQVQALTNLPNAGSTVLLYKPVGVTALQALQAAWVELGAGPQPSRRLRECWPLPEVASGLSIWSDVPAVVRRLNDRERPLEVEWLLGMPMAVSQPVLAALHARDLRVSLSHERDGHGQWRIVDKGDQLPWGENSEFLGQLHWRRQRLGRLSLAPLVVGQARWMRSVEKI